MDGKARPLNTKDHMETPTITGHSYSSTSVDSSGLWPPPERRLAEQQQRAEAANALARYGVQSPQHAVLQQGIAPMPSARIVKVIIADANEHLPLDKRILYSGDEKLTDLTDQELFFELPINELLTKHNEVRKATLDRKASDKFGRDIFLEPARVRDLKMVVVKVAEF